MRHNLTTVPRYLRPPTAGAYFTGLTFAACAIVGCSSPEAATATPAPAAPTTPAAPATPATPTPPELTFTKGERKMMGTIVMITVASVTGTEQAQAAAAIEAALDEMQRLERVLSEWDPDSEISRINQNAGRAVSVSTETLTVVKAGLEVSRWSEGGYDISWAALRDQYTFQPNEARAPDMKLVRKALPLVRYQDVIVDDAASTVKLKRAGMQIGTGSIAKGYALDRATAILVERGLTSFMIFGGGQVQVHGMKGTRPWRVGIQHPRKDDYFGFAEAVDVSISTSGDYEHSFTADGRRWHHILDLRTGLPIEHTSSVTVVCKSGIYADAMSTAVFVLGAERALAKLADAPGQPEVVIVDSEMRLHLSPNMRDKLVLKAPLNGDQLP